MQEVSGSIPLSSTKFLSRRIWNVKNCGAIAQLGERLHGMQEVSGSIPLSSTKIQTLAERRGFFYAFVINSCLFCCHTCMFTSQTFIEINKSEHLNPET